MENGTSDRFESLAERLIREASEAGEFDELPGAGLPLPGAGTPDEESWWIRNWMKRNSVDPSKSRSILSPDPETRRHC